MPCTIPCFIPETYDNPLPNQNVKQSPNFTICLLLDLNHTLANNRYVFASRTICLTAATAAIIPNAEKTPAMVTLSQNFSPRLEGLNVRLKKTTGRTKSRGMKPKAPITELMSPKKGSIAAIVVAATTDSDRAITLGMILRAENSPLVGSANVFSSTSFVGCR